jgi:cytochrome c553
MTMVRELSIECQEDAKQQEDDDAVESDLAAGCAPCHLTEHTSRLMGKATHLPDLQKPRHTDN